MAAPNSTLVLAGTAASGASGLELLWVAPTTAAAPTNAYTPMPQVAVTWEGLGYISTDGATLGVDEASNEIGAYGTGVPVRTVNTKSAKTLQFVCIETNQAVLEVYNRLELGTIVPDVDGDFTFGEGDVPVQRYSFVLDVVDGSNLWRRYYPSAEVKEVQERKIGNGESIQYGITVVAYPGADGDAVKNFYRVPALAGS